MGAKNILSNDIPFIVVNFILIGKNVVDSINNMYDVVLGSVLYLFFNIIRDVMAYLI